MHNAETPTPQEIGALVDLVHLDRLNEAETQARALLRRFSQSGMLWKILSVALLRQGKDAHDALVKTTQLMPRDAESHRNLGAALYEQGQWSAALASFDRALSLQPNDVESLVDAANALRALRRTRESVPLYQRALGLDGKHVEAHNNLGNAFLELNQPQDAVDAYRTALRLAPDDVQIIGNLGNALLIAGQPEEALQLADRAASLDPRSGPAHHRRGQALHVLGRREAAEAAFRHVLALEPTHVDALNALANLLRESGRREESLSLLRRSVELAPNRAESHADLATVLFDLRRMEDSVESFKRALALRPTFAFANLGLGMVHRQQGRPAEAEKCVEAALSADPRYVEALSFQGELRADRGRFEEAEALFRRAIALDPNFAPAYSGIATHRRMTVEDTAWKERAEALLERRLPIVHAVGLHYSLGKYFDDTQRYEEAFDHYRRANEMNKRRGIVYDRGKLTHRLDEIIRRFDAAYVRASHAGASDSERGVLIVGMPRSGTSLTEQILASHPSVFGAGEVMFWNAAYNRYRDSEGKGQDPDTLLPTLAEDYLHRLSQSSRNALRVVDKMPANFMHLGLIHAALPNVRIIHMQRHPYDTCLSIYFQNFFNIGPYANDLSDLAHYYAEYLRIMRHWREVLPPSTLLEVPYEALLEDQEGWSRRMIDFIGLPWDPKCLEFHRTERTVITASKWQVRQKLSSASAGRWRHYQNFVAPLAGLLPPADS